MSYSGSPSAIGETVWVKPKVNGEFHIPWSAKVLKTHNSLVDVVGIDGEKETVSKDDIISPLHPADRETFDDMIQLSDLREESILRNIHKRFKKDIIYTYIGDILVAVNPFKPMDVYREEKILTYQGNTLVELPPHIFAIGAQAMSNLRQNVQKQSIIISGESGSGKTESTKFLINFFASISNNSTIGSQMVMANPLLEAFGNAKTSKNDNSSRFGKYIEILFEPDGTMKSACVQHYLLEKSRIKSQNPGDRNYHIFYIMLAGLPQELKKNLNLAVAKDYFYLHQGGFLGVDSKDEKVELLSLKEAFKTLNFTETDVWSIFKILAAILHIGNFVYNRLNEGNDVATQVQVNNHLLSVIRLLAVQKEHFMEALSRKTIIVEGQRLLRDVDVNQAIRNRDAFAMALYTRLFSFVLTNINKTISNHKDSSVPVIGILDIFGFENFSTNSFEQFCINYANENLQQFFVQHIFKLEQEEYSVEDIQWKHISFQDNQEILDLLGKKSLSLLTVIDEEGKFPRGNDQSLLLKNNQLFSDQKYYIKTKSDVEMTFGIKHFAGVVVYSVEGFTEKNSNTLSVEWLEVIRGSRSEFLKMLFLEELGIPVIGHSSTLVGQYRQSLDSLLATLTAGSPYFVRCLKPNHTKQPNIFVQELVTEQMRYSGMLESAKIRQMGYPMRYTYEQFQRRYKVIASNSSQLNKVSNPKDVTKYICNRFLEPNEFCLGKTKVFLKLPDEKLEKIREEMLTKYAIILQKNHRGYRQRNRFRKIRKAAVEIQRCWRAYKLRSNFLKFQRGLFRLQARIRSRQSRKSFLRIRFTIIRLQALCRGLLVRKTVRTMRELNKKKNSALSPVAVSRKASLSSEWIDDYITKMFDNAIRENDGAKDEDLQKARISSKDFKKNIEAPDVLSFRKYADKNFTHNASYTFSNKIIKHSLLDLPTSFDRMAASAIWVTILRFMGDVEEKQSNHIQQHKKDNGTTILHKLQKIISAETSKVNEDNRSQKEWIKKGKQRYETNKSVRPKDGDAAQQDMIEVKRCYDEWLWGGPTSDIEKVHFIVGHAILRPSLRDEIYCQLCKQLTDNPNPNSLRSGWVLMSLCTGCFAPSPNLAPSLLHFFSQLKEYLTLVHRLQRTLHNGTRTQPPTLFELNALKNHTKTIVDIRLMDDSVLKIEVDSAMTAGELCLEIGRRKNMEDILGFSIFISMLRQSQCLEDGGNFIMDGVSRCEERSKELGLPPEEAPWALLFRRELYLPWKTSLTDPITSNLTYLQIIRGLASKEYPLCQVLEMGLLVAQHYYVSSGKQLLPEILQNVMKEVIPETALVQNHANWSNLIINIFNKSYFIRQKIKEETVKMDVIKFTMRKWSLHFSRYYEATQIAGFYLGHSILFLGVNLEGIFVVTKSLELILRIPYLEILSIEYLERERKEDDQIHIVTLKRHEYRFKTHHAKKAERYAKEILEQLVMRSRYAVAVNDYNAPGENVLHLKRGDLIVLSETGKNGMEWLHGYRPESGHVSKFPRHVVYILPTVTTPSSYILELYRKKIWDVNEGDNSKELLILKYQTLEKYAARYFRSEQGSSSRTQRELWRHSPGSLWAPLHRAISHQPAISMFDAVLHYMGDNVLKKTPYHTRTIFEPPLHNEVLRDELYCQLMKQLTDNPKKESEAKGWQLLVLATGLFAPSSILSKDTVGWLQSRPCVQSEECLKRLNRLEGTEVRRLSHHWMEVLAVQTSAPILHTVQFPNSMEHIFELDSLTKVQDLVEDIGKWLGLKTVEGFSLVVSMDTASAIPLSSSAYIFDAILDACNFPSTALEGETPKYTYDLLFVKKLWLNINIGFDKTADIMFHYYQELPKYLAGSHNCSTADAMYLGALIFIADSDETEKCPNRQVEIVKKLPNLIPEPLIQRFEHHEWYNGILRAYEENRDYSSDEAKLLFLKIVESWPNFGSAFFKVHSSNSFQDAPMTLIVNCRGVTLADSYTQQVVFSYCYSKILSCSSTRTAISLKVSTRQLIWYTSASYKISDLINSYLYLFDSKYQKT